MFEIEHYVTQEGEDLFGEWVAELRDTRAAMKVLNRIDRLALGNYGDHRELEGGVFELRIDTGPGYRVYAARVGKVLVLLLCGGSKKTQQKDIDDAKTYLKDYQARRKQERGAQRPARGLADRAIEKPKIRRGIPRRSS
ncbi:MAG: type II toxin-antitoxin system RelE/ParE family toxin [Burkholderiales bacterium]